jgi:hypothetical protein
MRDSYQDGRHDALDRWLAAERDGRADESEAALLELFAALPMAAPPAGFADRVLLRAGLQTAERSDLFAWRPLRVVLALCLAATGFGTLWLPAVLRALAGLLSVNGLVQAGVRAAGEAAHGLASALRAWDLLLTVGRAVAQPLSATPVMACLLASLLASSLAFRYLRDHVVSAIPRPIDG